MAKKQTSPPSHPNAVLERRHLVVGWSGLLVFLSLGMVLEILHGLKLDLYLDVRNSTRRLMWSLAHAHGTLFSLVHIGFAVTVSRLQEPMAPTASRCFTWALLIFPLGFLLGGIWLHGGDPGLGIFLVPVGALLLLAGVGLTLRELLNQQGDS